MKITAIQEAKHPAFLIMIMLSFCMIACGNKPDETINAPAKTSTSMPSISDSFAQVEEPGIDNEIPTKEDISSSESIEETEEDAGMKLFINGVEVPVIWEDNDSVEEIAREAEQADIVVQMSMYSDFEQVGPLGRKYSSNDQQTTTHNGDIVLYSSSNIVMFYGSNSWAYTRLGKMDLSEKEVTELLSNGDVTVTLKK